MNNDFLSEYLILAADGTEISATSENAEETSAASKDFDVTPAETVLLGLSTVFVGLVVIIIICKITGFFCNLGNTNEEKEETDRVSVKNVAQPIKSEIAAEIDKGELLAAISTAIAEFEGTDVAGIKVISIKKV